MINPIYFIVGCNFRVRESLLLDEVESIILHADSGAGAITIAKQATARGVARGGSCMVLKHPLSI